jgi:hypothetical protein
MNSRLILSVYALSASASATVRAQQPALPSGCHADRSGVAAATWLAGAATAIGMTRAGGRVLHVLPATESELADESDRAYPPFMVQVSSRDRWFDPMADVERAAPLLVSAGGAYRITDSAVAPASDINSAARVSRNFNPWAVVSDWERDLTVRVLGRCPYTDFQRVVLARTGPLGQERLYLDSRSHFPLKLESIEFNYFLGPVHDQYLYTAWFNAAPFAYYPGSVIKLTDGLGRSSWYVSLPGQATLVSRDSAPSFAVPDSATMPMTFPPRFSADNPDTVRAGAHTFLLVNKAFTSVVTLVGDTVFVLDATGGEERAQRDSVWVGKLFPGHHPVTLVLCNAIWPHIAGLRFWVAAGARLVGHPLTHALVTSAIARRWVERPDRLERQRAHTVLHFVDVSGSLKLAGGGLTLYELDGAASEGILMAYIGADRFLWASDRIQLDSTPSLYVADLQRAVMRAGIHPLATSGPHFRLIPWSQIERVATGVAG